MVYSTTGASAAYTAGGHRHAPGLFHHFAQALNVSTSASASAVTWCWRATGVGAAYTAGTDAMYSTTGVGAASTKNLVIGTCFVCRNSCRNEVVVHEPAVTSGIDRVTASCCSLEGDMLPVTMNPSPLREVVDEKRPTLRELVDEKRPTRVTLLTALHRRHRS